MRNIFHQYKHPENRLTHSLAVTLNEDKALLKDFLRKFGPDKIPHIKSLHIIGQGLPGDITADDEDEAERRGLPDAVIFNNDGWALAIESKIRSSLGKDQLQRHAQTLRRRGFDEVYGLTITVGSPSFSLKGWRTAQWQDIYAWASESRSTWARHMVDYFNVAESSMAQDEYLEGTITQFSSINFDPQTYLEGKRVLRLLTDKIRKNAPFMKAMRLDPASRRPAITDDAHGVWDMISFRDNSGRAANFTGFPHCTFGLSGRNKRAEAMITFPNAMDRSVFKKLKNSSYEDFADEIKLALASMKKNLRGVRGYKPVARIVQRHYKSQRSAAVIDGEMSVDLRACFGGKDTDMGRSIPEQEQWLQATHALLSNKRSNMQFQLGAQFLYETCPDLKTKQADRLFTATFLSLAPLMRKVIGE